MSLGSIVYIGLLVGICLYFVNGVVRRICQCIEKCNAAEWRADVENINFTSIIITKRLTGNQINQMKHRRQNYEKSAENRVR